MTTLNYSASALILAGLFLCDAGIAQQQTQVINNDSAQTPGDAAAGLSNAAKSMTKATDVTLVTQAAISAELQEKLQRAYVARGDSYKPRTEHFQPDGTPRYINRLILEDSPYLLQHAHNPVDWYPWGDEAFQAASVQGKPVFLSIGYATCHWCHVMERESFEDEAIAQLLNDSFIAIKVDREQLPDVDATYMTAVQMITGRGGWPMSTFLQPDGKPFHGGTYYPPNVFTDLLGQITTLWIEDSATIADFADRISKAIASASQLSARVRDAGEREIELARTELLSSFDDLQGGFGPAPKFMREPALYFLLDLAQRNADSEALHAADFSLQRITAGGIHDHVGGGFHRYAVDNDWLVPHFEKMLYNQAALGQILLQASQLTGHAEHDRSARRLLDYVLREMTDAEGGFYSATDADSEGEEGAFFIWTAEQIAEVLGAEDAKLAKAVWGVTEEGNFESRNILHLQGPIREVAASHGLDVDQLTAKLNAFSASLLKARNTREPPLTDRKIITGWNGMMITSLAKAGDVLHEPLYIEAAKRAAGFIWRYNHRGDGQLWRAHFNGNSSIAASQADYAYLAQAMLALHDVTAEPVWIERAILLVTVMDELFWDVKDGGYFIGTLKVAGAALPSRPKDLHDNAMPTGNSVALQVLARLWHRTGNEKYRQRAEALLSAFSSNLSQAPSAFSYFLLSAGELLFGESGARQYAARGKVKAQAVVSGTDLELTVTIAAGWHINSAQPIQDYLIATRLTLAGADDASRALDDVRYPKAVQRVLGFQRAELSLYEGEVVIRASLPAAVATKPMQSVELQLQACSDEICLAPQTVVLNVAVGS